MCHVTKYSTIRLVFRGGSDGVCQGLLHPQPPSWKRSRPWERGCVCHPLLPSNPHSPRQALALENVQLSFIRLCGIPCLTTLELKPLIE